jgi:hypothetical protein
MEFIEMLAWVFIGFVPTLGLGNVLWSHFEKRKENLIPLSV